MEFKSEKGYDFYKSLKETLLAREDKPQQTNPSNLDEVVKSLDDDVARFKSSVVSLYVILKTNYNNKLNSSRAKALRANLKRKHDTRSSPYTKQTKMEDSDPDDMVLNGSDSEKINRFSCIPNCFYKCDSHAAKIAIVLYLMQSYTESLKKAIIIAIMNKCMNSTSVSEIVGLCKKSVSDIRKHIKDYNVTSSDMQQKLIVWALVEMSEMLKDKNCSKLAMDISQTWYIAVLRESMKGGRVHTIAPFDALINKYVRECIPLHDQDNHRKVITNQFKISIQQTINDIIKNFPPAIVKMSPNAVKSCQFDATQEYEYYVGPMNYTKDIVTGYIVSDNKRYKTLIYNDCLYDVLGSTDLATNHTEIYDNETWRQRLAKLPYRTKIIIEDAKGSFLNDLNITADLTVSWMNESNLTYTKTFPFKKREKKLVQ